MKQENGAASKLDPKAVRIRGKNGANKKNPAKKRKVDALDESINANDTAQSVNETINTEEADATDRVQVDGHVVKEQEAEPVASEEPVLDDTQTSDACDAEQQAETEVEAASASLVKPKKTVVVDVKKLEELLEVLVFVTKGWHVEKMLRLYTKLAKLADRYSKLWNRDDLTKVSSFKCFFFPASLIHLSNRTLRKC